MKKIILVSGIVFLFVLISGVSYGARPVRESSCRGVIHNRPNTKVLKSKKVTDLHDVRLKRQRKSIEKAMRSNTLSGVYAWG